MMPNMTTTPVSSGIGWSNGMAAQVSSPNMLMPRRRPGSGRQLLRGDALEQAGFGGAEGERRRIRALPGQVRVAGGVEGRAGVARGGDPGGEAVGRHRLHLEMHGREAIAAVVAR